MQISPFEPTAGRPLRAKVTALAHSLSRQYAPTPTTHPAPPTVTHTPGGQGTLVRYITMLTLLNSTSGSIIKGGVFTYDSTYGRLDALGVQAAFLDFYVTDTDVEIEWGASSAGGDRIWVFVDGQPVSAPPTTGVQTAAAGAVNVTKLSWGSRARRRVTFYAGNVSFYWGLRLNSSGTVSPAGHRPKIAVIGDSYIGGSAASGPPQDPASVMSRILDVEVLAQGHGGSGYVSPGFISQPFGHATRVAHVAAFNPDLVVFFGSINDQAQIGVQAAAAAAYAAYATALPTTPLIVMGPQPTDSTNTVAANQYSNAVAVRAAALAAGNVVAYFDPIGFAAATSAPVAYTTNMTVTTGQLVSYKGSIYKVGGNGRGGAGAPASSWQDDLWQLQTWGYTGTGRVGTTTGDGTRDVVLYSDGTHPTVEGSEVLGSAIADAIVTGLRQYAGLSV